VKKKLIKSRVKTVKSQITVDRPTIRNQRNHNYLDSRSR